jgi:hypothetical protein
MYNELLKLHDRSSSLNSARRITSSRHKNGQSFNWSGLRVTALNDSGQVVFVIDEKVNGMEVKDRPRALSLMRM